MPLSDIYYGRVSNGLLVSEGCMGKYIKGCFVFVLVFFVLSFIFYRQIYINGLGLSRHVISGASVFLLTAFAIVVFFLGIKKRHISQVGILTISSFGVMTYLSVLFNSSDLTVAQLAIGVFWYVFGFFYFWAYPTFQSFFDKHKNKIGIALLLLFAISVFVSVQQFFKYEPYKIFETDDSVAVKENFFGITRVNGLYGNFVDYAYVCYLFFLYFFSRFVDTKKIRYLFSLLVTLTVVMLTFTRAYIFLALLVPLIHMLRMSSVKSMLKSLLLFLFIGIGTVGILNSTGEGEAIEALVGTVTSEDKHTQDSNQVRIKQLESTTSWAMDYFFVGEGPGFLLGPNEKKKEYVTDGIVFMNLIELGTISFIILYILIAPIIVKILLSSTNNYSKSSDAKMVFYIIIGNVFTSVINSALALPSSLIVTAFILGKYHFQSSKG